MPTLTIQFEKLKKRFADLNQDVLDSFISQHGKLTEAFSEALENFLLAKHIETQGNAMNVIKPTESTAVVQPKMTLPPLTNARQKESYHYATNALGAISAVSFSEECGLSWDSQTQAISGVPTLGGKEITVIFTFADGSQKTAQLYINADPRSLWNNIPSEQLVKEFWKADSASAREKTAYGELIAGRMRGRSHAHKGTCCDDDFAFGYHAPTGIHFLAVADGAGSAEYSRLGSKVAVEKAKECFFDILNDVANNLNALPDQTDEKVEQIANGLLYNSVAAAYKAQQDKVNTEITQKSLSCTLLLTFTLPLKSGKWFTAAYWVGDGAVATFDPNINQVRLLGESDGGAYSGETQFLTKAEFENDTWKSRISISLSEQAPILFAMTDGVSDPKFKNDTALSQAAPWAALWAELQEPLSQTEPEKALEQWLDFWSVGEHDDRTLAMFIPNRFAKKSADLTACEVGNAVVQAVGNDEKIANFAVEEKEVEQRRAENSVAENIVESAVENLPEITITLVKEGETSTLQIVESSNETIVLPAVSLPENPALVAEQVEEKANE